MGSFAIRLLVAGLCLVGTVGAVRAQGAHRPSLEAQARAERARRELSPVFTVGRAYEVDRSARAATRRLKWAEGLAAWGDAFDAELDRLSADARHRRLHRKNMQLWDEHERLGAECKRLRC